MLHTAQQNRFMCDRLKPAAVINDARCGPVPLPDELWRDELQPDDAGNDHCYEEKPQRVARLAQ